MDLTIGEGDMDDGDEQIIQLFEVCNSSRVNIKKLRNLIESGVDVNQHYNFGGQYLSPLGVVCNRSDIDAEAVRVLLDLGADVNGVSRTPFNRHRDTAKQYLATPLALACDRTHIDIEAINILLDHGAKLQDDNYTMLDIVCNRSDISIEAIQTLVAHGADINEYSKSNGLTPVMVACHRPDIDNEALRVLVELGADLNLGNKSNNDTAIMLATEDHVFDKEATVFLLDSGSDVNVRAKNGTVLLHGLVRDLELMKRAIQMGADTKIVDLNGWDLLHYAAVWGNPETVSYLIDQGFPVNGEASDKSTPAMSAASGNSLAVLKTLIDAGADIHGISKEGCNILHWACLRKRECDGVDRLQPDVVKYLIDQGIDVNKPDKDGWTPLFYAVTLKEDTSEIVNLLLNAGADIEHQSKRGKTVLDLVENPEVKDLLLSKASTGLKLKGELLKAIHARDTKKLRDLLDAGANVNELDGNGRTPIWYAPTIEIAQILIDHGADLNILDRYENCLITHFIGQDYIDHAMSSEDPVEVDDRTEMLIFLMEHGAKPGLGDLGSHGSSKNQSLSLAGVSRRVRFESNEQWDRFQKLYVTKDTVNLSSNGIGGYLLNDLINGNDLYGFGMYESQVPPEYIIHLLDLGAWIQTGYSNRSNRFVEYLGNPVIIQSKDVVRKFLDVIASGYYQDDILNSSYSGYNSTRAVPLLILMIQKHPEFVKEILDRGANPNAQIVIENGTRVYHLSGRESFYSSKTYEDSALMVAVPYPEIVEALIKAGADVNAHTSEGDTALKRAKKGGYTESVELLKKAGAK